MERHWSETLAEGTEVRMAFLAVDLAGSSTGTEAERRNFHRTVEQVALEFGGALLGWHGEGTMGFFYDPEGWPEVAAFRAAQRILERLLTEHGLTSHLGLHSGRVTFRKKLGRDLYAPELNKAGHLGQIAPPSMVLLSADVAEALPDELRDQIRYYGTSRRDGVPCFSWPRHPGARPEASHFLPAEEDLWEVRTRYLNHLRGWTKYVRLVGVRQIRKAPTPELLAIFEPPSLARLEDAPRPALLLGPEDENRRGLPTWARWRPAERLGVRQALSRYRSLALVGDPGAGKTTLLRYLAHVAASGRRMAARHVPEVEGLVPLLAPAGALHRRLRQGCSLLDALADFWKSEGLSGCGPLFERLVQNGRTLVLIDALDELAEAADRVETARRLGQFASLHPAVRLVVTSRRVGFDALVLGLGEAFEIQPLEQINRLARGWFVEFEKLLTPDDPSAGRRGQDEAGRFVEAVNSSPGLRDLLRNPFLLALACLVHRQGGALPRHRVELYDLIGQTLIETWDAVRSLGARPVGLGRDFRREAREVLWPLARHLHAHVPSGLIAEKDLIEFLARRMEDTGRPKKEAAQEFLKELRQSTHLLVERGPQQWGFMHQTFQEFFAAQDLVAGEQFLGEVAVRIYDSRWREVIRLVAGILGVLQGRTPAASALIRRVLDEPDPLRGELLRHNLFLAADSLVDAGGAEPTLVNEMVGTLTDLAVRAEYDLLRRQAAERLGALLEVAGPAALAGLEASLASPEDNLRSAAVRALGRAASGQPQVAAALLARLDDAHPAMRAHAARALGEAGAGRPQVVAALLARLDDADPLVRSDAAWALEQAAAGQPQVVAALLARLNDANRTVRVSAARALGQTGAGQPQVVAALLASLDDADLVVRVNAAWALGRAGAGQPHVVAALLARLDDADPLVRAHAAWALGEAGAGQPQVVAALLARLDDAHPDVRASAARALGEAGAGQPQVVAALLARLDDADPLMRAYAAWALGEAGAGQPQVVAALNRKLADPEPDVRLAAAGALVQLGAAAEETATALARGIKEQKFLGNEDEAFALLDRLAGTLPAPPCEQASRPPPP